MRWIPRSTMGAVLACWAGLTLAAPMPVFGPRTYERTTGETDSYTDGFEVPDGGSYVLFLRNGDVESSRVTGATVEVNGVPVVQPSDLNELTPGLHVPVELMAGLNEILVELSGSPGSFVTAAIFRPGEPPVFVHGRLVLPWGRSDTDRSLMLALKNGSTQAPRAFRVVFFAPSGEVAAVSQRFVLPPRASVAVAAEALMARGDWQVGSVEVFYAGPGVARLFGTARQLTLSTADGELQALENAGFRVFRARRDTSPAPHGRSGRDW